ncbi:biopolymer transporter ExbD [Asticcacaulis sp. 201]|uniref:ExbD/TolR family protein n=1 Tax=Asticcacaulis sp. 201 TaxID=3028787 RepID=UPI002916F7D3|nr:biopolymer transporter ExbD [Asticcacaulis sp. 201]MDV6332511.1 biopolymer transporter ExbD [Asticcacaulis sp. 201]
MAMGGSGGSGAKRRGRRRGRRAALSEINVTPMVDVMLVLLIIFMISAPLLNSGIKIELPKTEAAALKDQGDPITVSVDKDGNIYVNDDPASYEQMAPRIEAMTRGDTDTPIYVRGAGAASWDAVAKVMGKLSTAGFVKINLVTDTLGGKSATSASHTAAVTQ